MSIFMFGYVFSHLSKSDYRKFMSAVNPVRAFNKIIKMRHDEEGMSEDNFIDINHFDRRG